MSIKWGFNLNMPKILIKKDSEYIGCGIIIHQFATDHHATRKIVSLAPKILWSAYTPERNVEAVVYVE